MKEQTFFEIATKAFFNHPISTTLVVIVAIGIIILSFKESPNDSLLERLLVGLFIVGIYIAIITWVDAFNQPGGFFGLDGLFGH